MNWKISLIAAACVALASCQTTAAGPGAPSTPRTVSFGCENGTSLTATFSATPDAVDLMLASGERIALPRAASGSGARYASATHEFWNKGDEATLTVGRASPTTCRVAK